MVLAAGDVSDTWADCTDLANVTGYNLHTLIEIGLGNFVTWYKRYYGVN